MRLWVRLESRQSDDDDKRRGRREGGCRAGDDDDVEGDDERLLFVWDRGSEWTSAMKGKTSSALVVFL